MRNESRKELVVGSVVQIIPTVEQVHFRKCLAMVTELKQWGVNAIIMTPNEPRQKPVRLPVELQWRDIELVGKAPWPVSK